jgi:hypothetical protein
VGAIAGGMLADWSVPGALAENSAMLLMIGFYALTVRAGAALPGLRLVLVARWQS